MSTQQTHYLPCITLDLDKICHIEPLSGFGGSAVPVAGHAMSDKCIRAWGCAVNADDAVQSASKAKMNLDAYLTAQIAVCMNGLNRKLPILVWFANAQNIILLYVSSQREFNRLSSVENSYDCGAAYIPSNAEPFMYYSDGRIYRIYHCHPGKAKRNLLCDLGMLWPNRVGDADESRYHEIVKTPHAPNNLYYSPVLSEPEFISEWERRKVVVERAFCSLRYSGTVSSHEEEWPIDDSDDSDD